MSKNLELAIEYFDEFEKSQSREALVKGLRSFADMIENHGKASIQARSAVDILTNDELAQTIADLKATLQAFAN